MSTIIRKIISTAAAPKAIGPYSQAVRVNDTLYISGQLGIDPTTNEAAPGGVEAECRQALLNVGNILKAAGGDYKNVVKTTVLLADMNDFTTMNNIYKEYFKEPFPARAAYQVVKLPKGLSIEIECIAVLGDIQDM